MNTLLKKLLTAALLVLSVSSFAFASDDDCFLDVRNPDKLEPEVVLSLSQSLISKYIKKVEQIPRAGIGSDACLFVVSVKKSQNTLLVTIAGDSVDGIGESSQGGYNGIQEAMLRAVFNGKRDKRSEICRDFRERIKKECADVRVSPASSSGFVKLSRPSSASGGLAKGICSLLKPGRDYRHCKLSRKVYRNLNLSGSDFSKVNLERSRFINCNLTDSSFREANLERSSFENSTISRSDFTNAELERARFINTTLNEADFTQSKMDRVQFNSITLNRVVLREAQLEKANFNNATLNRVDLSEADLEDANFRGATLNQVILRDADLDDVDFSQSSLNNIVN